MKFIKNILSHELISGSFYIFVGAMFANVLAFLLNLFLARNLTYADYGIFASLLSIITLAMIAGSSMNTIIVRFSAGYYSKNETDKLKSFYKKSAKFVLTFSFFVLLFFILASPFLSNFLHLNNYFYLVLVGMCVFVFYMQTLNLAFLQGLMRFGSISIINSVSAIIKLAVGIFFVFLGMKAFSGLWSIFFMGLGAFFVGFIPLRRILSQKTENEVSLPTKEILTYALPAFVTVLFLTSFTSMDVIMVKHYFSPHLAGFYAGLSLIGKVIFYFTAPIPMVMFPLLIKRHNKGEKFHNLFYLSLILVLLPSIAITAFYFLFPRFVINLFLGGRDYLAIVPYLGFFAIYLSIFSLMNICVSFFLSFNKTKISFLVVTAAILQIILISLFHSNFYQVIGISLSLSLVLLVALLLYYFKLFGNLKNIKNSLTFSGTPAV